MRLPRSARDMDHVWLVVVWQVLLALSAMPLGFMLGSSCSPCCVCGVDDGKPRTNPKNEGTWVPSGTWRGAGGVTWTFTANPGDDSGETWFFYGSSGTSAPGRFATFEERQDWGNICNWYSSKTTAPNDRSDLLADLNKRALRLPPSDAVVHAYSNISTSLSGPVTIKNLYFWLQNLQPGSELTTTGPAHDSVGGSVFDFAASNRGTINGGATFNSLGSASSNGVGATVNGSVTIISGGNEGTINGNAELFDSLNAGTINGNAEFFGGTNSTGLVTGNAILNEFSRNSGDVDGSAVFYDSSSNLTGTVNDGATFNNNSGNGFLGGTVNNGAVFNDNATNGGTSLAFSPGTVNGGAIFNDNSVNRAGGTVNGGAVFNDASCSERVVGSFNATPCTRQFVAHPSDVPTCNGTAPDGCANAADTCGCG